MYQSIKRPVKEKLHQIKKKMRKCLNLLQQVSLIEVDLKKLSEFTKDLLYSLLDISDFQISKVTDKSIYMFSSTVNKIVRLAFLIQRTHKDTRVWRVGGT